MVAVFNFTPNMLWPMLSPTVFVRRWTCFA